MSILFRVYGSTADTYANPTGQTTHALARSQTTSTAANVTAISAISTGQSFSSPNYFCRQAFLQFDTSAAPTSGAVSLAVATTTAPASGGDFLEVSVVSSLTNKIAGASLSSLTQLGSVALVGLPVGRCTISLTGAPTINAALKYVLYSRNERLNTAPTANEAVSFRLADTTGTTDDPYLDVLAGAAWTYVAAGTSVEATATSHILTEPAGVAAGDLLVACIGSRIASTTQITLPSGWTRVNQALNNNTLSTSSALPSGMMAYIIRGASAPPLTFTHPVAPNVALGRVVAYRNVHPTTPLDTGTTAVTTGTALLAISVTGLTTTADDDLIVALAAGGQEAAWSDFNATDPATGSGTTSASVLNPIWGQWLERADVQTTTGNDGSLAIFDAVKQTAGATGNLIATASVSAGHVVVAGSFKLAPPAPTGTTYNETVAETLAAAETLVLLTESKIRETEAADWRETESGAIRITEGDFFTAPPIEASVAESAGATDTVAAALAYTKAVAETAAAADTTATTLTRAGAIAETAAAVETVTGPLTGAIVVAETANAIETITASVVSAPGVFDETVVATAAAVDTVSKTLILTSAIAENAGANETVSNVLLRIGAIAESASAVETINGLLTRIGAVAETVSAAETTNASIVPAAAGMMVVETAPVVDSTDTLVISTRAIVETASAAETIGKTLSLASTVSETAAAVDTVGGLALRAGAVAETAAAVETINGLLIGTTAIVETAAAAETITYSLTGAAGTTYNEAVLEVGAAADTVTGRLTALAAVAEAASAFETITQTVSYTRIVAETAAAADTVGGLRSIVGAIAESTSVGRLTEAGDWREIEDGRLRAATGTVETITATVVPAVGTFHEIVAETASAAETTAVLLTLTGAIVEAAAAAELTDATVIRGAVTIDVTVAETMAAVDAIDAQIDRWTREPPPPWANWVEEAITAAGWTKTAPASASWTREDADGDWLLETRPVNQWTKE